MSNEQKIMTDGSPVTTNHRDIDPKTGMQKGYVVLSEEERAKGFVRPVRQEYTHVGPQPRNPDNLRDLTPEEERRYGDQAYAKFEEYPKSDASVVGRFWKQKDLDDNGCRGRTTMDPAIAETYARKPDFYGSTFCAHCKEHFPVGHFIWVDTDEVVGS